MTVIGEAIGCGRKIVAKILKENNIVTSKMRQHGNYISKKELIKLYLDDELSTRQIARIKGISDHKKILKLLKLHGIEKRHRGDYTLKRRRIMSLKRSKYLKENPEKNPMRNPQSIKKMVKSSSGKHSGELSNFWKGGITPKLVKIRNFHEMDIWRKLVFERDNYTCQLCGNNKKIHAHHIKRFKHFKELRTDINNGITLCKKCHNSIHGKELFVEEFFNKIIKKDAVDIETINNIKEEVLSKIYNYRSRDWLVNQYSLKKRKISDIARECNVYPSTIRAWLKKYKIPYNQNNYNYRNKNWLVSNYFDKNREIIELAEECDVDPSTIRVYLRKYKIPYRQKD